MNRMLEKYNNFLLVVELDSEILQDVEKIYICEKIKLKQGIRLRFFIQKLKIRTTIGFDDLEKGIY